MPASGLAAAGLAVTAAMGMVVAVAASLWANSALRQAPRFPVLVALLVSQVAMVARRLLRL
ncbi:hypothetical protein GJ699_02660 [Duganella sp. FT80W]|uniref:Uncharacterized protein n=1 Tax=Duganella guangzhouensis TaxID=2666084 RepID=A0A6I2KU44_9BURK|nr:hypothetical protein [Duganella guangzhouensis]MRW88880.1 hypothetical protein [Duganella guangzhouensis]